jgi:hypothetical protein
MKKALVAAILGIALNITASHGQGYIIMQNYKLVGGTTPVYSGITYGTSGGAKTGQFVGAASGFKVDLLFSLDGGTTFNLAAGSQTPIFGTSADGGTPTTDGAGSFLGPTVTIPGYTSGNATFEVRAFNGASYGAAGSYNGISAPFTIAGLNTNPALPSGDLLNLNGTTVQGLQPFVVNIPEPSIFALAGLGAAGLMAFRRKK